MNKVLLSKIVEKKNCEQQSLHESSSMNRVAWKSRLKILQAHYILQT